MRLGQAHLEGALMKAALHIVRVYRADAEKQLKALAALANARAGSEKRDPTDSGGVPSLSRDEQVNDSRRT